MYDLIVIGAGPAGITASVYAARKMMNFLVVTKDIGGQAALSGDVENYTGYQFITGPELAAKFEEHMRQYDVEVRENEYVLELKKTAGGVFIQTNKATYESKAAIIASGKRSKELNVRGEKEFKNKGLTYCATCDAPLFFGKNVAVVGGGNSALDATLQLIKIAKHAYLININPQLGGEAIMREKIKTSKSVTILNNTQVAEIIGDQTVRGVKIRNVSGKENLLAVEGVFVEIGLIPNSDFVVGVKKNESGEIAVNNRNETNIPGVFAAGDVTDVLEKQIVIAAGEGSKAALAAFRYLMRQK